MAQITTDKLANGRILSRGTHPWKARFVFDEIAQLSFLIRHLSVMADSLDDEDVDSKRDREVLYLTLRALTAQVGMLADIGASDTGGVGWNGPDVEQWFLPPAYHDRLEKRQRQDVK